MACIGSRVQIPSGPPFQEFKPLMLLCPCSCQGCTHQHPENCTCRITIRPYGNTATNCQPAARYQCSPLHSMMRCFCAYCFGSSCWRYLPSSDKAPRIKPSCSSVAPYTILFIILRMFYLVLSQARGRLMAHPDQASLQSI